MNNEFQISHIENKQCFACGNNELKTILDLGDQPLANEYHSGGINQIKFPLKLNLCDYCYHLQLSHTVNPDLMFKNYLYVSGTTQTLKDYFDLFAKKTLEYAPNAKNILDIANNDGTQLDSYQKLGLKTYGIDPAVNLYNEAVSKGHKVICDYFNLDTIKQFNNSFDIITAQNVFAHNKYTVDFLLSCKTLMHDESVLFIQTSQANMVLNNEFDTIYHEHLSFFNTNSMKTLVKRCGLVLSDVFKTDIHGTSYVFVITKKDLNKIGTQDMIQFEKENGLYDILTYPSYALKCYKATFDLKYKLEELKNQGYTLIGYGAAAKGNTLLNFGKIKLDIIIDDNPLKQNLLTPGMNIPIVSSDYLLDLNKHQKIVFIPLAWNFYNEIKKRIKNKRDNNDDIFIKYFPNIIINK
jgi:2-polyprenyl-3-methyl-5-hydroxy-6-metoxy-1,4-benzoquinol methylase